MSKKIGVIFGGPSPEHDISILTGLQSVRILSKKYEVSSIYWSKDNKWYLVDNLNESVDFLENKEIFKKNLELKFNENPGFYQKRKKIELDVVVNACHGGPGEDGSLQSLLYIFNIKYCSKNKNYNNINYKVDYIFEFYFHSLTFIISGVCQFKLCPLSTEIT